MGINMKSIIDNLPRPPNRAERLAMKDQSMNPITICRMLTLRQWCYFTVGLFAWIMDAFDFCLSFAVSLTLKRLEIFFDKTPISSLQLVITLTLLFRSFGAFAFGLITDRYGRRWPLTVNLLLIAVLELGSGFVQTFPQFLAVRSLFGVGMGGIWGMAAATSLENVPLEARGFLSGVLQQGYALGYLIAAGVNLTLIEDTDNWRNIFFLGAGLSAFVAILRALCPESEVFLRARQHAIDNPDTTGRSATRIYWDSLKMAMKLHWRRFIFAVLLMTGFNFLSHGSQDLYPTYAQTTKGMTSHQATVLTMIGNGGAIVGGTLAGYISQYLGRRLTIMMMVLWVGAFIPLWILPNSFGGLAAGAFFLQFGVQGAWGVIPVYLNEIAPPAFRAIFAGLAYQLGNMVSSASAQIEATAGDQHQIMLNGKLVADYAFVQGILIGIVAAYILVLTALAKEFKGRAFEAEKTAIEQGGGDDHENEAQAHARVHAEDKSDKDDIEAETGSIRDDAKVSEKGEK